MHLRATRVFSEVFICFICSCLCCFEGVWRDWILWKNLSQFCQIFFREQNWRKKSWEILQKFNYTEFTKNQIRIWRSLKLKFHWLHFINQEAKFWSLLVSKVILDMTIKAIRPKNLGPWFQKIKPVILDIL